MMVFFKTMCRSRRGIAAGLAKLYAQTEAAFYWSLGEDDLETPTDKFTCEATEGVLRHCDARDDPLDGILALLMDDPDHRDDCGPHLLREYYSELRAFVSAKKGRKQQYVLCVCALCRFFVNRRMRAVPTHTPLFYPCCRQFTALADYRPLFVPGHPEHVTGRRDQTPSERLYVASCCALTFHEQCTIRGKRFNTKRKATSRATDNSGFMVPFDDGDRFGEIVDIIKVRADKRVKYAARVRWYTLKDMWYEHIPRVTKDKQYSERNKQAPVVWLSSIHPDNVVYWPADLDSPSANLYVCLWRNGECSFRGD
jgi:hypothetical protein